MRTLVSVVLTATQEPFFCARKWAQKEGMTRVECPACGYELEAPSKGES
jgi:hypothetical protein